MKRILKKKCKRCGKTFLTRDLNVEYCNKGCEFDFEPMDTKELDKKPKIKYVNGLMEAIEEPEKKEKIVIKPKIEVKKEVKQEIKKEKKEEPETVEEPTSHLIKTCPYCAKKFKARSQRQRYCTRKCAQNHFNERKRGHGREVICKVCGKSFTTSLPRQCYCSDGCRMDYKRQKAREYSDRYRKRITTIMNLDIGNETVKQIANAAKSRIINESIDSVTDTPPYLAETNLANYIIELEQKLTQIDNTVQLYKQLIDDNNRERVWLSEHIDRLKHIMDNSASVTEHNQ